MGTEHLLHGVAEALLTYPVRVERLYRLAERLRRPDGCAWDRDQTIASCAKHLREEASELCEAIEKGDPDAIREEAGDLLWNIAFLVRLAEEQGLFPRDAVAMGILEKLIRRHPHVFGGETAATPEEALAAFNRMKDEERRKS